MRLFWELTKRSFQRYLAYRAAVFAGLITNFFFGLLRIAILIALYGQRSKVAGVDIQGAITYMIVTQAAIGYLSIFSWWDLMRSIYTGEIASDLLRPLSLFTFWLAQDLGRAIIQLLLRGLLLILLYIPFFEMSSPQSPDQWIALALSLSLSWLISFSWRFLVNLAAFWTPNAIGIGRFFFVLSWFCSGFLMPLRYYPDWVIQVMHFTPFPSMLNTLMDVSIGILSGSAMWQAITQQALWCLLLIALSQLILRTGVKRLVILGG